MEERGLKIPLRQVEQNEFNYRYK